VVGECAEKSTQNRITGLSAGGGKNLSGQMENFIREADPRGEGGSAAVLPSFRIAADDLPAGPVRGMRF
jgi:hypothetical protein